MSVSKGVLRHFRRGNALTRSGHEKKDLISLAAEHGGCRESSHCHPLKHSPVDAVYGRGARGIDD